MSLEMLHPASAHDVAEAMRSASATGARVMPVGGRRHMGRGEPVEVDAELWTTQLDATVAYEPAEMIAVVEAGTRVGDLELLLAEGAQEWPVDAPADATVGGVIAAAASSARRLLVGAVRDTVLEIQLVTGDGRLVRGGARTVKNVTGYDLPRLATGSLGTLGVIVQAALKLRPLPKVGRTLRADGVDGLRAGERLLAAVPSAAGVLATSDAVEIRLEGWDQDVVGQAEAATKAVGELRDLGEAAPFPSRRPWEDRPIVVEAAVPASRVFDISLHAGDSWGALLGVGIVWAGFDRADGGLWPMRQSAAALGGIAPVVSGPGGLGETPIPAPEVHRRLKAAFDPAGVLSPGRLGVV